MGKRNKAYYIHLLFSGILKEIQLEANDKIEDKADSIIKAFTAKNLPLSDIGIITDLLQNFEVDLSVADSNRLAKFIGYENFETFTRLIDTKLYGDKVNDKKKYPWKNIVPPIIAIVLSLLLILVLYKSC